MNRTQYVASTITNRNSGGAEDYDSGKATVIYMEDHIDKKSTSVLQRKSKAPPSSDIITVKFTKRSTE